MNKNKIPQFITTSILCLVFAGFAEAQTGEGAKIKFTTFSVKADEKRIKIDWATDNTIAANYFEIQKSSDGVNFKTIALVLGPDPKQLNCDCYQCFDKYLRIHTEPSYYRLKHIGLDGAEQFSETRLLDKI